MIKNKKGVWTTLEYVLLGNFMPKIKPIHAVFHNPYTTVVFEDGTNVVIKTQKGTEFDEYNGLCIAIAKKSMGSNVNLKKFMENNSKTINKKGK